MSYHQKLLERFNKKILKTDTCWIWIGAKTANGYGKIYRNKKTALAHRVSYELFKNQIPNGLVIDHICKNTSCVNPEHLRVMTQKQNILISDNFSAKNANKTKCLNGHEFNEQNTYRWRDQRLCKPCRNKRCNKFYHNKKLTVS